MDKQEFREKIDEEANQKGTEPLLLSVVMKVSDEYTTSSYDIPSIHQ